MTRAALAVELLFVLSPLLGGCPGPYPRENCAPVNSSVCRSDTPHVCWPSGRFIPVGESPCGVRPGFYCGVNPENGRAACLHR